MHFTIFNSVIIILALLVVILVLFRRLHIPPMLGYFLIGSVVGPHALQWVPNTENILYFSQFGLMFLMFTIGLEFSFSRLKEMKHLVLGLGSAQVIVTTLITMVVGIWLGMTIPESIIVGAIVAMSSTAIVLKQLSDQLELNTRHADYTVAILLFQDLAAIPFFILIPSLAAPEAAAHIILYTVLVKSVVAILAILIIGHWIVRPLFREVVGAHSLELFTLAALLIAISAAWITQRMGLSIIMGPFLAGMILAETEFRHQLEAVIRPFRDIFVGLFFISLGMLFNLSAIPSIWNWGLLLLFAILFFKALVIFILLLIFRKNRRDSLRTALILAQGGEFGFALLTIALTYNLLPSTYGQVILGALLISMAIAPIIIKYHDKIVDFIFPDKELSPLPHEVFDYTPEVAKNHVILCGYGRIGQNLGRILEKEDIFYRAIDLDLKLVQRAQALEHPVIYGDATLYEILLSSGVKHASALVITFEQNSATLKILQQVRSNNPDLPIFIRTADDAELEKLQEYGATEVIPATLETTLMLASHVLTSLQVPIQKIWHRINQIRKNRYQLFNETISGEETLEFNVRNFQKRFVTLSEDNYAIGKRIVELNLDRWGILLAAVMREGVESFHLPLNFILKEGDILMLYGFQKSLDQVDQFLRTGEE